MRGLPVTSSSSSWMPKCGDSSNRSAPSTGARSAARTLFAQQAPLAAERGADATGSDAPRQRLEERRPPRDASGLLVRRHPGRSPAGCEPGLRAHASSSPFWFSASVPPHSRLVAWPSKRPNCRPSSMTSSRQMYCSSTCRGSRRA